MWDRQLEDGLPECRVSASQREAQRIVRGRMAFDLVYCGCCSKPSNFMVTANTPFAFFLCDDCAAKAVPPNAIEIPMPEGVMPLSMKG